MQPSRLCVDGADHRPHRPAGVPMPGHPSARLLSIHPTPPPTMFKNIPTIILPLAAAVAIIIDPTPARASLNEACDAGNKNACIELATLTAGQCSSPGGLGGCRFDSLSY